MSSKKPSKPQDTSKPNGAPAPEAASQAPTAAAPGLPLFYNRVEFLNVATHGKLNYLPMADFGFAAHANYIPVTVTEFGDAASSYPIVFAGTGETLEAVAIVGRKRGENQQVEAGGKWRTGAYVPAYVRRYPFILISDPERNTLSLGADVSAANLKESSEGEALYKDGQPTETAKRALQFCLAYQQAALQTRAVCRAIENEGILIERAAEFTLPSGKVRVTGFKIVDEAAFNSLPDDKFLALRKVGALPVIHAHLMSMKAWRNLLG